MVNRRPQILGSPKITLKRVVFVCNWFFLSNFRGHEKLLVGPATGAQSEGWHWETGSKGPPSRGHKG